MLEIMNIANLGDQEYIFGNTSKLVLSFLQNLIKIIKMLLNKKARITIVTINHDIEYKNVFESKAIEKL